MSFWDGDGPPKTKTQRGAAMVQQAIGALEDARCDMPYEVWQLVGSGIRGAQLRLEHGLNHMENLDKQICDQCDGRWKEDPKHLAYCESKPDPDEHKAVRDALRSGVVRGGTPLATHRAED